MKDAKPKLLVLSLFLAAIFPTLRAKIADFDEVWQKRAEDAKKASLEAYNPHPERVTQNFNKQVHEYVSFFLNFLFFFSFHKRFMHI